MASLVQFQMLMAVMWFASMAEVWTLMHNDSVRMYFGSGCFFARQHLFIEDFERKSLKRKDAEFTAIAGYAGSAKTGPNGGACYHNSKNFSDYGALGMAEVASVDVPLASLDSAFAVYFGAFIELEKGTWVRPDFYDQGGGQYRSLVGMPGGIQNVQVVEAMERSNLHNLPLQPGRGSDPDTFSTNTVFIMDSQQFPFIQAELCLQFHDDSEAKYSGRYHDLAKSFEASGRITATPCPPNFICDSTNAEGQKRLVALV